MALVDDLPLDGGVGGLLMFGGFHLVVVVQGAQGRHLLCGERNAAVLAAISWMAGLRAMLKAIWRGWRRGVG